MTGRQQCEAIIRHRFPQLDAESVARAAEEFWNADPAGGLLHVADGWRQMRLEQIAAGGEPDPEPTPPCVADIWIRRADGGAEEVFWAGSRWIRQAFLPTVATNEKSP